LALNQVGQLQNIFGGLGHRDGSLVHGKQVKL
jgi:hypothetical protein